MEQVKLLSMTTVLTVLIWVSADSLVSETATINVAFEIGPAMADSAMLIDVRGASGSYEVEISGSRKTVEALQAQAPLTARLQIQERPTGPDAIVLEPAFLKRELASQFHEFRKLTITSVRPSTIPVTVDHRVIKEVDITMTRLALPYDVEPQLQRTSTTVVMRESAYDELTGAGRPLALDISPDVDRLFRDQPAGQSVPIQVALDGRAFGGDATLEPDTVRVTATVKAERSTEEVPTVPVLVAVSFANLEKVFRPITRDGTPLELVARTITVTGATDAVVRLVRGETRAFGVIRLKEDDFQNPDVLRLKTPEYYLPAGLTLAQSPEPVEFKLIDATLLEPDG